MNADDFVKLLHFSNRVDTINYEAIYNVLKEHKDILERQQPFFGEDNPQQQLIDEYDEIISTLENSKLHGLRDFFKDTIKKEEVAFFQESYRRYDQEFSKDDWRYMLEYYQNQIIKPDTYMDIVGRIGKYTRWDVPGMEFSPGVGKFTQNLVSFDPLYLVDHYVKIPTRLKGTFNNAYQRRLRTYTVSKENMLDKLPVGQFGFIFSWGFFERIPLDIMKEYFASFFALLRPGGSMMISYNDCSQQGQLEITLGNKVRAYNNHSYVEGLAYLVGFDDIKSTYPSADYSILECTKPGDLKTIRSGQALAEILKK